jgi:aminoglycoside 6'-N-acetyltransferase I
MEDHQPEIASFFAGTLAEPTAVLMAENNAGMIVGFAELAIRDDVAGLEGKRVGYVEGLYVRPEFRRQGVATKLLRVSRSWARDEKCDGFASDRAGRIVIDRSFQGRSHEE